VLFRSPKTGFGRYSMKPHNLVPNHRAALDAGRAFCYGLSVISPARHSTAPLI
jgi:hypothetical protein